MADIGALYAATGKQYGIDPLLLRAMAQVESSGNPNAVSSAGAQGLMQLMPNTARSLGVTDSFAPAQAIPAAARYLVQGYKATGTPEGALLYYHGGPNRAEWGPKTQAYAADVARVYQQLKRQGANASASPESSTGTAQSGASASGRASAPRPVASAPAAATAAGKGVSDKFDPDAWAQRWGVLPASASASPAPKFDPDAVAKRWGLPAASASASTAPTNPPAQAPAQDKFDPDAFARKWGLIGGDTTNYPTPALDRVMKRLRQEQASGTLPAAPEPQPSAPYPTGEGGLVGDPYMTPQVSNALVAGIERGAHDLLDRPAEWLASGANWLAHRVGAPGVAGAPTGTQLAASDAAARRTFNQNYSGNLLADVGRYGTQIAGTLPVVGGIGNALAEGGDTLAAGLGRVGVPVEDAARAVGRFLSGEAGAGGTGAGNLALRAASRAAAGGAQGATVTALNAGQSGAPILQQVKQGAEGGAALGGIAAPTVAATARGVGKLIARTGIPGDIAQLADLAVHKFGIPLRVDQITQSPFVRKVGQMSAQMPLSGLNDAPARSAFTRAVARTFGADTDRITPDVMKAAKDRIGATLSKIEDNHSVTFGDDFVDAVARIEQQAHASLTEPEYRVVQRLIDGVLHNVQPGDTISGETFGNLIHQGSAIDAASASHNGNIARYAEAVKSALRDAFGESLPPDAQAAYRAARFQYKNMMTVAPLVVKGAPGEISPTLLQQRVAAEFPNAAFAGAGDLGELAQIGQTFLKSPRDSGTPLGEAVVHSLTRPGALLAEAAAGHMAGATPLDLAAGAAGLGATIGINRGIGAVLRSPALADRLIESGLGGRPLGGFAQGASNALLGPYAVRLGIWGRNALMPPALAAPSGAALR